MNHWDDETDDWPDDSDDAAETIPCPSCGADIYEEAEQCPKCGDYVVHGTSPWNDKPVWWMLLGLAGAVAVILALLR